MKECKSQWLFPETFSEAMAAQQEMAQNLVFSPLPEQTIRSIAGMDLSNTPFDPSERVFGSAVVLSYPALTPVETVTRMDQQKFPYIPGLLGFREVPTLAQLYQQLTIVPDLVMVDGHGISHPRKLGVASHLGVLLDIPTIGVAKSILVGTPAGALGEEVGSMTPLLWKGKEIGKMIRTKKRCTPLIVSAGHKITLEDACEWVLRCLRGYRLPETTRQAHLAANVCRRSFLSIS